MLPHTHGLDQRTGPLLLPLRFATAPCLPFYPPTCTSPSTTTITPTTTISFLPHLPQTSNHSPVFSVFTSHQVALPIKPLKASKACSYIFLPRLNCTLTQTRYFEIVCLFKLSSSIEGFQKSILRWVDIITCGVSLCFC